MQVELSPEQEVVIRQVIATGKYHSINEVIDSALDTIRQRERIAPALSRSQLAGQRIRQLRMGVTLGGISIKELIEEGRV